MTENEVRVCSQCHSKCLLSEFKANRLGVLRMTCETCRERRKKYNKKYNDAHKQIHKQYYEAHKEHITKYQKNYQINNELHLSEYKKQYYEDTKDDNTEKRQSYRKEHREKQVEYMKKYSKSTLDIIVSNKLTAHRSQDLKHNRQYKEEDYINSEWIKERLIKCSNRCEICQHELKLAGYEFRDPKQWSVDRIDNKIAHIMSNCHITCWNCNKFKH
jgi:hypothetical protein